MTGEIVEVQATVQLHVPITHGSPEPRRKEMAVNALAEALGSLPDCHFAAEAFDVAPIESHETYSEYLVTAPVVLHVDEQRAWERAGGDLTDWSGSEAQSELLSAAEQLAEERLSRHCRRGLSFGHVNAR